MLSSESLAQLAAQIGGVTMCPCSSDPRYLLHDVRGSVVALTDGTGATLAINSYDEYGLPAATNLGRFEYTGQAR